ncbi:MAG: hypothetical protein ACC682_11295 [Gemmatimonadota bacterium]
MSRWPWIVARLEETPPELAVAVRGLLGGIDAPSPTPERMVDCALVAFERVASTTQTRAGALELLAADALLTYAFEAAADPGVGGSADAAVRLARATGASGEIGCRSERSG